MIIVFLRTFHAYLHDRRQLSLPNGIGKSEFSEISRFLFRVFFISFFLAFVFLIYQLCLKLVFPLLTLPSVLFPSLSTLSSSTTPIFTVLESDIGRRLNEETSSLFGIISSLDPVVGTLSFIIIVAAVMFVDFAFYGLSLMSHDTPFEQLLPAIQKELMIAGCTAFVFKIIVNASNNGLSHTWFIALEYADLVVPIFSFVYCFIGLILISMSVRQCDLWSKAYHMKLLELLDEFFDYSETVRFQYFNWIPNNIVTELEFRIFHNIFCDAYKIQRKAFAFDEYVDKVFERFVMEIVEIRSWDWFIVSLLFTLNIIRMSASINFGKKCEEHDKSCKNSGLSEIFALGGLLLFVLTVIVAFYSRYLELKIMKSRGILNIDHYYNYLHHMEHQKERVEEHVRMDVSELKAAVEQVKNRGPKKKKGIHSFLAFFGGGGDDVLERLRVRWPEFMQNGPQIGGVIESFSTKLTNRKKKDAATAAAQKKGLTRQWSIFPSREVMRDFSISEDQVQESMKRYAARNNNPRGRSNQDSDDGTRDGSGVLHSRSLSAPDTISRGIADHNDEKEDLENGRRGMHERANTTSMVTPDIVDKDFLSSSKTSMPDLSGKDVNFDNLDQKDSEGKTKTKGEQDIALNFPFGRPVLYFETVQIIILLTSLYLALWITNFDVAADSATWKILTLLPGVGSAIVYLLIVKTAALLKSVSELDNDAVLEVIEQTEGSRLLGITMREKILSRLRDLGEPQAELFTLFHEIDSSRNGSLSREEFAAFLNAIEINFSRKKWQQIFREIDLNYDDKITFEEFFLFLFPDHDVGLALEKRRMKLLGSRVKIKADRYEKESKRKRTSILHSMFHTHHALILPAAIEEEEQRQDSGPSKVNHNIRKARTGGVISPRDQPRTNYAGNGAATSFRNSIVSPRDFTGHIASATAGILSPDSNKPGEAPYRP